MRNLLVTLMLLSAIISLFSRCAPVLVIASFDPEGEAKFQARQRAELLRRLDPCLYDAVDLDGGEILCHAYDCSCHRKLVERVFERAKKRGGFPR